MASNGSNELLVSSFIIGEISVCLKIGDVTQGPGSVIVHCVGPDFNLSAAHVTKTIIEKAGNHIQVELDLLRDSKMRITGGGNLISCPYIFHIVTPTSQHETERCMMDVLREAGSHGINAVSIPAIATSSGDMLYCGAAEGILKAFRAVTSAGHSLTQFPKFVCIYLRDKKEYIIFKEIFGDEAEMLFTDGAMETRGSTERGEIVSTKHLKRNDELDVAEYVVKKRIIVELSSHEIREISNIAEDSCVTICLTKEMRILGWEENVARAIEKVNEIFCRHREDKFSFANPLYFWQWKNSDNAWTDFGRCASGELEGAFERYRSGRTTSTVSLFIDKEMRVCEVDFRRSSINMISGKFTIRRHPERLPELSDSMGNAFEKFDLRRADKDYIAVEKLVRETLYCQVVKIQKIQNKDLYLMYKWRKDLMESKYPNEEVEKYLFHGTSTEKARLITRTGFDLRFAGQHGLAYGRGIYFAKRAAYSHRYASADARGCRTLLLSHVATGRFKCIRPMLNAPVSPRHPAPLDWLPGDEEVYQSGVDNIDKPMIFVVFNELSAYPAYEITYKG